MCTCRKEITIIILLHLGLSFQASTETSRGYIKSTTHKHRVTNSKKFELSSSGGRIFTLNSNVQLDLQLRRTEDKWSFVIFHSHSKYQITQVSAVASFNYSSTNIGADASILEMLPYMTKGEYIPFYVQTNVSEEYQADVISTPYNNGAPLPGGCCLTCSMPMDPNLYISYTSLKTTLLFSHANVYYRRGKGEVSCDSGAHPHQSPEHYRLEYSLYQVFLEEGNLDQDTLFQGLEMMSSPSTIKSFGKKIASLKSPSMPRVYLDTVPGQPIIYNIIVYDPKTDMEAAYTPAHTYGCSFTSKIGNCDSVVSTINKVIAVIGAVIALFMCFMGHRYFKLVLFLGGLMNCGFICFIILSGSTSLTHTGLILCSTGLGAVGGILVFLLWWFTEYVRLCLLINSLFLGFLAAGCLMFSPVGNLDVWQSDFNYGMIVTAITIIIPFVMLPWPKLLSIVYTSVVSAYGFIIGIDAFLHTSMSYLVLNIIIRAIETDYDTVIVNRPYQSKDIILSITWGVLALLGMAIQHALSRNKPDFAKSGYLEQKRAMRYYNRTNVNERTPILVDSHGQPGYKTNEIC